jgi:hypothetical protein
MSGIIVNAIEYPDPIPLTWAERGSGTINIKTDPSAEIVLDAEFTCADQESAEEIGGFDFTAILRQGESFERIAQVETRDSRWGHWADECLDESGDNPEGRQSEQELFIREEIIGQYDRGEYGTADAKPGPAELVIQQGTVGRGQGIDPHARDREWVFDVRVPQEGLPIAENATVEEVRATTTGTGAVDLDVTVANPANHGITIGDDVGYVNLDQPQSDRGTFTRREASFSGTVSPGTPNVTTETIESVDVPADLERIDPGRLAICFGGVCDAPSDPIFPPDVTDPDPSFSPGNVTVIDCGVSADTVTEGDRVTFSATIDNANETPAIVTAKWSVGGVLISRRTVTINGNSAREIIVGGAVDVPPGLDRPVSVDIDVEEAV